MATRRPSKILYQKAYDAFRSKLVEARETSGLTQRDVAERLGRPPSYVANCESGERRVDVVELMEFAKVYGRSVTYFLNRR
jgi:transcriptional regulator with XRE-family HTH domain